MDVGKAFTFVFEDDEWISKLGIGAVLALVSFLIFPIFLLGGYLVAVTRNVRKGVTQPLPHWDDWGQLFMDGLYIFLAQIIYSSPFWILLCVATAVTVGSAGLEEVSVEAMTAVVTTTWVVVGCLTLLLSIALLLISPALFIQYVRHGEFGAMFRLGEVFGIARDNAGPIIIAALALFGFSLALSVVVTVLSVIPCLGTIAGVILSILSTPWLMAATGHLYGQIARSGEDGGKPASPSLSF
jgi:amino acid transporter